MHVCLKVKLELVELLDHTMDVVELVGLVGLVELLNRGFEAPLELNELLKMLEQGEGRTVHCV